MDMVRKKDDDDDDYLDKLKSNIIDNIVSIIPLASNIQSALSGYDFTRIDMQWLSDCADALIELNDFVTAKVNGEEPKTTSFSILKDTMKGLSYLTGIPAYNIERDLESLCRTIMQKTGNKYAEYVMLKMFHNIKNEKKQGIFKQFIYNLSKGEDQELYNKVVKDAIENGLDERKLFSYMKRQDIKNGSSITKTDNETGKTVLDYTKLNTSRDFEKAYSYSDGKDFSKDVYARYNQARNIMTNEVVGQMKQNSYYANLNEDGKEKAIKNALKYTSAVTAHEYGQDYKKSDEWILKMLDAKSDIGMSESEYILYKVALSMNDIDGNGSIDKAETELALDSLGFSDESKAYLYGQKYTSSKTNPYTYGNSIGISREEYKAYTEALKENDADGNGSYKKAEVIAALDSMDVSRDVKARIYDSKYKRGNPYR